MNLVSFSIKTKGPGNFARRLRTVFTRFGFTEARTRHALYTIIDCLAGYHASPTFFIPAIVLRRHPSLLARIASRGSEIGIHGYVHNDYRHLSAYEQFKQTQQAIAVFKQTHIPYAGFRNPYLGWTQESLRVFTRLGFQYESNEAVLHNVIDLAHFSPSLRIGYAKSLQLFQAIPSNTYTLRPHFEGTLLRIPTSIPDDEMLFDRLRITNPLEVGRIWSKVMERVYDLGGLYTLNLHPERAIPCRKALAILLSFATSRPLPIWIVTLQEIAQWWNERSQFRLHIIPLTPGRWHIAATCTSRATLLARHLTVEDQTTRPWHATDACIPSHNFRVEATRCPCIGVSPQTPQSVVDFLYEQGYPAQRCSLEDAHTYAYHLDLPGGIGTTREEQARRKSLLVGHIEQLQVPLLRFACWPDANRAALAISGDIDSVTIQDFFLRILEVRQHTRQLR